MTYHAEEDHAGAGAAQRLVCGGCDDVAVLEGLRCLLCCHQATAPHMTIGITTSAGSFTAKIWGPGTLQVLGHTDCYLYCH